MRLESMIYLAVLGLASLICLSTAKTLNERYSYTEESQRTARNIKNEQKPDVTESISPTNRKDPRIMTIQRSDLRQLIMESLQTMLADVPHDVDETTIAVVAPPEASTRNHNNIISKPQNRYGSTESITENPSSQLTTYKSTKDIIYVKTPNNSHLISDSPKVELTDNKRWQSVNDGDHLEKQADTQKFISSSTQICTSVAPSNTDNNKEPPLDIQPANTMAHVAVVKPPGSRSDTRGSNITSPIPDPIPVKTNNRQTLSEIYNQIPPVQKSSTSDESESVSDRPTSKSDESFHKYSKTKTMSKESKVFNSDVGVSVLDAPILSMEYIEDGNVDNEVPIETNQETGLPKGERNIQDIILGQMMQQMGLVFSNSYLKVSEVLRDMLENVFSGLKVPIT